MKINRVLLTIAFNMYLFIDKTLDLR